MAAENMSRRKLSASMVPGKLYVMADAKGSVIGTARIGANIPKNAPIPHVPIPNQDHKVHEIDDTSYLQALATPEELHKACAQLIK